MNRAFFIAILIAAIFAIPMAAQDQGQDRQDKHDRQAQSAHRVRKTNATGWIRKDGDNYVLENDNDQQRYRIQNSEAVREHEGHHVKVHGRLHEDDRSLEVNQVKRDRERKTGQ